MDRLQQLISDNWTIRRHELSSLMALIMPGILAGNLEGVTQHLRQDKCTVNCYNPHLCNYWDSTATDLPENSVMVIRMRGTLYSWESDFLANHIQAADDNPRICGIVLDIDGPGGMVSHLDRALRAIRDCTKPVATVVTGCMASAHFWLGTAADRTFIVSDLCEVGSVGVIITHTSFREFFKKAGIDIREIYPDTADLKNEATRALLDNNDDSLIKSRAEQIHLKFASDVARNLNIDYDPALPLFRGRMFPGQEAVSLGYIDELADVEDAARWVVAQSAIRKIDSMID